MRAAFTILLNGYEHLIHNNYYKTLVNNFDLWVIAEGVSMNDGSTSWCNKLSDTFHNNFLSNDGSSEFIDKISQENKNVKIVRSATKFWKSKDEQVNAAVTEIRKATNNCNLWQIDIDEQWTLENLVLAEEELKSNNGKTGCFLSNYYVGKNQIVTGEWGEGAYSPYRRLWNWRGEEFETHEPPKLKGKNGPGLLLTPRFNHYAYYFEKDVIFKEAYYSGYTGLVDRWKSVQKNKGTIHVRELLGQKLWWSHTNTYIQYKDAC